MAVSWARARAAIVRCPTPLTTRTDIDISTNSVAASAKTSISVKPEVWRDRRWSGGGDMGASKGVESSRAAGGSMKNLRKINLQPSEIKRRAQIKALAL